MTVFAWISEERLQRMASLRLLAPVMLCAAVFSLGYLGPLIETFGMYGALRKASKENFESGFRRDRELIVFSILPSTGVISEEPLTPGKYSAIPVKASDFGYSSYPYYILAFFEKGKLLLHPL